jgi:hypothetical protein
MSMAVQEQAMKSVRNAERAAARRAKALGVELPKASDEVTDYERQSALGRAVRLEIDVCIPLAELRKNLASVRNEINNALAEMDKFPAPEDQRKAVHWKISKAKSEIYYRKKERETRDLRAPQSQQ